MNTNVGGLDRTIRFTLGTTLIIVGLYFNTYWGLVGLVPLATAFAGWCPAYLPFRISTAKTKK